jgi:hypothetical protein
MLQALSAPLSQAHCLKVQVHLYQVMLANPDISSKERQALKAAREAHGPESDQRACTSPIAPEAQALLRCLGITQTVPEIEACIAEAKHLQAAALSLLLDKAAANTERLRAHLLAQQAAGEPLVAFQATPATIPPDTVAVEALPDGPGKAMLLKLGLSAVHCTYAVHTRQYNYRTQKNDGPPFPGGFALVTQCDLDGDGLPAYIGADAKSPAKQQNSPRIF